MPTPARRRQKPHANATAKVVEQATAHLDESIHELRRLIRNAHHTGPCRTSDPAAAAVRCPAMDVLCDIEARIYAFRHRLGVGIVGMESFVEVGLPMIEEMIARVK